MWQPCWVASCRYWSISRCGSTTMAVPVTVSAMRSEAVARDSQGHIASTPWGLPFLVIDGHFTPTTPIPSVGTDGVNEGYHARHWRLLAPGRRGPPLQCIAVWSYASPHVIVWLRLRATQQPQRPGTPSLTAADSGLTRPHTGSVAPSPYSSPRGESVESLPRAAASAAGLHDRHTPCPG